MSTPRERALEFLAVADLFRLGDLPTEKPHPRTSDMSDMARRDLQGAIAILKSLDLDLLQVLKARVPELEKLRDDLRAVLGRGGRVFLGGCGATGRLSLSLEVFWREQSPPSHRSSVFGFMAGGDSALIKSIEKFEDHPEYGERQLRQLGFREGDLLIASTEGGETPFVIGAAEYAAGVADATVWFLYCNPDDVLSDQVERSRNVLRNPRIGKINLSTGPQALSGSTRMQASTILMYAIGLALFGPLTGREIGPEIDAYARWVRDLDFGFLEGFIEAESACYRSGGSVVYETNDYGITILTDTTERSPTFSLLPFENVLDPEAPPSLCYLSLPQAPDSRAAWETLLRRPPRPLDWPGDRKISTDYFHGFDISAQARANKERKTGRPPQVFSIRREGREAVFAFAGLVSRIDLRGLSLLSEHATLKMLLNIHSTLIMGRLGRYRNNIMIWVKPSNNKLIDRSIRYVLYLLKEEGIEDVAYDDIAFALFEEMEGLREDEPVVLKTLDRIRAWRAGGRKPPWEDTRTRAPRPAPAG